MLTIVPPVSPFRGTRGMDSYGSGNFGASRDGGARRHLGLDFISTFGDSVVAPFSGVVTRIGVAYHGTALGSIHIQGDGEFATWRAKILYVRPEDGLVGRAVVAGDHIGDAQDVAAYHQAQNPGHAGAMTNHVHLEILVTEPRNIDPAHYLPGTLLINPVAT